MSVRKGMFFLAVLLIAGASLLNAATVSVSTDKAAYGANDTIHVSIGATQGDWGTTVDLYFVLLNPENKIYFFPGWSESVDFISDVELPPNFNLQPTPVFNFSLPSNFPPIVQSGNYTFAIGLTEPGTLNFISIDSAGFSYTAGASSYFGSIDVSLSRDYSQSPTTETVYFGFGAYEYKSGSGNGTSNPPPLDGCVFTTTTYDISNPPTGYGAIVKGLDAGEKILVTGSSNGDIHLLRTTSEFFPGYTYESERDFLRTDYTFNNTYHFIGTGAADIASFNISDVSMSDFKMQSPVLSGSLTIDRSKALNLSWTNPLGSPYELDAYISSTSIDILTMKVQATSCSCRFVDDGSATIPSEYLKNLVVPVLFMGSSSVSFSKSKEDTSNVGNVQFGIGSSISEHSKCTLK
jgi:hypothetical protein